MRTTVMLYALLLVIIPGAALAQVEPAWVRYSRLTCSGTVIQVCSDASCDRRKSIASMIIDFKADTVQVAVGTPEKIVAKTLGITVNWITTAEGRMISIGEPRSTSESLFDDSFDAVSVGGDTKTVAATWMQCRGFR